MDQDTVDGLTDEVTDNLGLPNERVVLDDVGEKEMILYEEGRKIIL